MAGVPPGASLVTVHTGLRPADSPASAAPVFVYAWVGLSNTNRTTFAPPAPKAHVAGTVASKAAVSSYPVGHSSKQYIGVSVYFIVSAH